VDDDFAAYARARYSGLLRSAALILGRDRDHAEDLVQEALARVYVRWRSHGIEHPDAFVRKTMVNLALSRGRREVVRQAFLRRQPPPESHLDPAVDEASFVWAAVASLPTRQRAVIVMRYYEGLPYEEISRILGISAATARSQCLRARETLRRSLQETEVHQ
jgi:RNA polymerase sigma-70 factor (sigma-E family)